MELLGPLIGLAVLAIMLLIGLGSFVLMIWCLVQVGQSQKSGTEKALWILVILFFPFLGSIAYLIAGRDR